MVICSFGLPQKVMARLDVESLLLRRLSGQAEKGAWLEGGDANQAFYLISSGVTKLKRPFTSIIPPSAAPPFSLPIITAYREGFCQALSRDLLH